MTAINVTINTDASFDHRKMVGGYAFWITTDAGRWKHSGVLKTVQDATIAEIMCIANALVFVSKLPIPVISHVIINTDSTTAISYIKQGKTEAGQKALEILRELNRKHAGNKKYAKKQFFYFKHVKAHTSGRVPRTYVNNWCDVEARKQMRAARNLKQDEQTTKELLELQGSGSR